MCDTPYGIELGREHPDLEASISLRCRSDQFIVGEHTCPADGIDIEVVAGLGPRVQRGHLVAYGILHAEHRADIEIDGISFAPVDSHVNNKLLSP